MESTALILANSMSPEGIALWIIGIAGAIISVYVAIKKARRSENSADTKAKLEDEEANANFWRRQYELKVESDKKYMERLSEQIKELYARCREAEEAHIKCREDHAETSGELTALKRQNAEYEKRILKLEEKLDKAGIK